MFAKTVSTAAWMFFLVGFIAILLKSVGFELLAIVLLIWNTLMIMTLKVENKGEEK